MRRVIFVVPDLERTPIANALHHDTEKIAKSESGPKPIELKPRVVQVFDNFAGA